MEDYIINLAVYGVISWTSSYLLLTRIIFPNQSSNFCTLIVSIIHAILAVILSSLSVQDWSCPVCPLASTSSPPQMKALAVTLAYLIYDLLRSLFDEKMSLDYLIHHLVSIIGIGSGLVYQKCGTEMVASLWITEISNPLLHLRELLKEIGHKDSDLNLAVDVSFAVSFTVARMVIGPYVAFVTLTADNPFVIKAMCLGLSVVSVYWFYKIARMVKYKLTTRSRIKTRLLRSSHE